jgi:hypothetical protein
LDAWTSAVKPIDDQSRFDNRAFHLSRFFKNNNSSVVGCLHTLEEGWTKQINFASLAMEQIPDGRVLCRAVGVSFEGRQTAVRKLQPGQNLLLLLKHLGNGEDTYGIGIFDRADCKSPLGFIGRDIKHHRVFE